MFVGSSGSQFSGSLAIDEAVKELCDIRMELTSTTRITASSKLGGRIYVNGEVIQASNIDFLDTVDNLLDSTGADSTAPPSTDAPYYAYVSNSAASFMPSALRLSSQAPTNVDEVYYLGASGNALNWRFVGMVGTDASGEFRDEDAWRLIFNYYNRQAKRLYLCPEYLDNDAQTTWVTNNTGWNSAGYAVKYVAMKNATIAWQLQVYATSAGASPLQVALLHDTNPTTDPLQVAKTIAVGPSLVCVSVSVVDSPGSVAEGAYCSTTLWTETNGTNWTLAADFARATAGADPAATYFFGFGLF